jgi:signal transduction histidine kinase
MDVDVSIELAYEQGREEERHIPEIETAMYRIVQEALSNAAKHGNAKRAVVEVHEDETNVRVSVRDDGCGFDPSAHTEGFGLLGMNERVQLLDGTLDVDSSPGRGTTIAASFPTKRLTDLAAAVGSSANPQ